MLFSNKSRVLHDRVPVENIGRMTGSDYCANGCTTLLDAVGEAVKHIGNIHKYARLEDVPEHTLFVITTDGMENASRHYTASKVKKMIKRQQEKYDWEFVFLIANIDYVEMAESIGIAPSYAVDCFNDSVSCSLQYAAMSDAVSSVRKGRRLSKSSEWRKNVDEGRNRRRK